MPFPIVRTRTKRPLVANFGRVTMTQKHGIEKRNEKAKQKRRMSDYAFDQIIGSRGQLTAE